MPIECPTSTTSSRPASASTTARAYSAWPASASSIGRSGATAACPRRSSSGTSRSQHHAPCQAPCTSPNVVTSAEPTTHTDQRFDTVPVGIVDHLGAATHVDGAQHGNVARDDGSGRDRRAARRLGALHGRSARRRGARAHVRDIASGACTHRAPRHHSRGDPAGRRRGLHGERPPDRAHPRGSRSSRRSSPSPHSPTAKCGTWASTSRRSSPRARRWRRTRSSSSTSSHDALPSVNDPREAREVALAWDAPAAADAFAAAELTVRASLTIPRVAVAPMEGARILAVPQPDGRLAVYASTQAPHWSKVQLARSLGLPPTSSVW